MREAEVRSCRSRVRSPRKPSKVWLPSHDCEWGQHTQRLMVLSASSSTPTTCGLNVLGRGRCNPLVANSHLPSRSSERFSSFSIPTLQTFSPQIIYMNRLNTMRGTEMKILPMFTKMHHAMSSFTAAAMQDSRESKICRHMEGTHVRKGKQWFSAVKRITEMYTSRYRFL